ncbi:flavin reductase family protein [Microvirga aerilata]|uniref:flavin reductase family protein n=1 Tax=Microvirga aerilata TaxID=670292 RepID=UPI00363BDAE4
MHSSQGSNADIPQHRVIEPPVLYFGTPVALITTLNPDGTPNISPMSSAWALNDRVVLGMGTSGQGTENMVREGECVINLVPAKLWEQVERIARTTGRNPVPEYKAASGYYHEPDKFEAAGFTPALGPRSAAAHCRMPASTGGPHRRGPRAGRGKMGDRLPTFLRDHRDAGQACACP